MKLLHLFLLSLCIVHAHNAQAHSIRYEIGTGGIVAQAFFDDQQPAKGLSVSVFVPDSFDKFQTGKTDLNGRFVFFPDRPGDWEMLIFDQMGHRLEIKIPVNEAMKTEGKSAKDAGNPCLKIVIGVAVILIFFGMMGWIRKEKNPSSK
jgi:nickel transport protein